MAKKTRTTGANIAVPQSKDEARASVARIGVLARQIARDQATLNDRIAKLKEAAETAAAPLQEEADRLTEGLKIWGEANRRELTGGDKTKTVDLGTGEIKWRLLPARVSIKKGCEAAVIEACKRLGFQRFVRTIEEPNKEAMRAEADLARTVPGVSIGSEGEAFVVEPFEVELAAGGGA